MATASSGEHNAAAVMRPPTQRMSTASSGEHSAAAVMIPPAERTQCESYNMSTKRMTSLSVLYH